MQPVKSSAISAVDYDPKGATLKIAFASGDTWHYTPVPADLHQRMMKAPSIGGFFHQHIRKNFTGTKIDG